MTAARLCVICSRPLRVPLRCTAVECAHPDEGSGLTKVHAKATRWLDGRDSPLFADLGAA